MDICSHDAVDEPIVLEDDGSDTELDTAMSDDDDDDRNLEAMLPPDANGHHISVPAVPAKPVASGQAEGSATTDSDTASSGQSLSDRSVKPKGVNNSSQQSVQDDEHGLQDLDRTITACPDEAGSDGLSTGCLMERDGGPRPEMEDQHLEPTGSDPTAPNPPSRKRSGPPPGSHVPSPKRSCGSSRVAAQRAREMWETSPLSTRSNSHKEERLRHVFPRHCRDKDWDVEDLRISVEEDGSLKCELLWAPTTVSVSTLKGELLERAEELVKRDHGAETWDNWLEMQGKTGRRCRSRGK